MKLEIGAKGSVEMVIQLNMSPNAIVEVWGETEDIFIKYNIPLTNQALETLVETDISYSLLKELNSVVGSTTATCVEGG